MNLAFYVCFAYLLNIAYLVIFCDPYRRLGLTLKSLLLVGLQVISPPSNGKCHMTLHQAAVEASGGGTSVDCTLHKAAVETSGGGK